MTRIAIYYGEVGRVVEEKVGYVVVQFPDGDRYRLLKCADGLRLIDQKRGRPRKHGSNAARQKAYRARKAENYG